MQITGLSQLPLNYTLKGRDNNMKKTICFLGIALSVVFAFSAFTIKSASKPDLSENTSNIANVAYSQTNVDGTSNTSLTVDGVKESSGETVATRGSISAEPTGNDGFASEPTFEALSMETTELGMLRYWLYTPSNPTENMPLIVYLHSASGKGDDLNLLLSMEGLPKYLNDGTLGELRAYVIMPQLPTSQRGWVNVGSSVIELINKTVDELNIDTTNISLTGHSVGGTGTWNIAIANDGVFSRIAPLSGSVRATNETINALKNTPVRAFVGSDDIVIDPALSQRMVDALKSAGANAEITVFEGADHEAVPALTYLDKTIDITNWLINNQDGSEQSDTTDDNGDMNMYQNSDFIEKEQPELTEETKQVISAYQKNPTMENYLALRDIVIENYDAVLVRKEAKLAELKEETAGKPGGEEKVAEMEEIVQEMYITYWNRINSSMLRFTDTRLLKWKISEAANYDYIPVMGAGESLYVKRTPVTNAEYAEFISATGYPAPLNWTNGTYPTSEDDYPVNYVSFADAQAYCAWLTEQDGINVYRMPSESEWELAAGHMPKDADFNCGVNNGRVSVETYASVTRGAHGAIDFWGNVWEWTSTERNGEGQLGVKGGSWKSPRTDCRTEHRKEGRNASAGYEDVGFRVIKVLNGQEPEQKVDLYTLDAPVVKAEKISDADVRLTWQPVETAVEYQIYSYSEETGLFRMLDRTSETSYRTDNAESNNLLYVVQALSYTELSDNVSPENAAIPSYISEADELAFLEGEVILIVPAGAIPEGALFDVQKIVPPPAEIVEKVKDQMGASSEVLAYYEIRLSDTSGELITRLDGEITIKTKMPEQYTGTNCVRILQEDETGKLITMESWWEGEYLCYKTDWLEIYN